MERSMESTYGENMHAIPCILSASTAAAAAAAALTTATHCLMTSRPATHDLMTSPVRDAQTPIQPHGKIAQD